MLETGSNVIYVSSMNAYAPLLKMPAYSGTKVGIRSVTQWVAVN